MKNAKYILLALFLLSAFLFVVFATVQIADAMNETYMETTTETETETEIETEFTTETDFVDEIPTPMPVPNTTNMYEYEGYYYMLCRVVECNEDTFTVVLPNGEMEIFYMVEDPPIDEEWNPYFEQVTFVIPVEDIDNLDKWEVKYVW